MASVIANRMIEKVAIVSSVSGCRAWIEPSAETSCGGCPQKGGCSTSLLDKFLGTKRIAVDTDIILSPGDKIVVGIDESALIRGSLTVYLFPLLALFLGGVTGEFAFSRLELAGAEGASALSAVFGFLLSFLMINRIRRGLLRRHLIEPVVLRKL